MRTLTSTIIVLALSLCCTQLYPAYSKTKSSRKIQPGSISGRVTLKGKGKAGIIVGVRARDLGRPMQAPALKTTTDPDGNYHVSQVPPGNYDVLIMAPAYVISDLGSLGPRGKTVVLAEGENVEDIDFALVRGGVITGKITHADGRPVVEERINVLDESNHRLPMTFFMFSTDDRGIYRIYGLPAGRYKISVGQEENFGDANRGKTLYESVFYPNVTDPNEAKLVEIGEGSEVTNIDITLGSRIERFAVSGRVLDGETGRALPGIRVGINKLGERRSTYFGSGVSNGLGEFRLDNVIPGKYGIFMMQQSGGLRFEPVTFEVIDQNVEDITVRTTKGASLSGFVVVEGNNSKDVVDKLTQLRLEAHVHSEAIIGNGQSSLIGRDGSFMLGGLGTGMASFHLHNTDHTPIKNFVISRVEREGVVQPHNGLEIKAGEQISGLRIVLLYGTGLVRGTVNFVNGPIPQGMHSMARLSTTATSAFSQHSVFVDSRGHFVFEGVPAGSFEVIVRSYAPGLRRPALSAKQPITVTENGVTEIILSIDLNSPSNP